MTTDVLENMFVSLKTRHEALSNGEALDGQRLLHGRGQTYTGLEFVAIDFYHPVLLVTLFSEPDSLWLSELQEKLLRIVPNVIKTVIVQRRHIAGAPSEILLGELVEPLYVQRKSQKFLLTPMSRQNIGFFLDMEPGRQWLEKHCAGKRVLNLFSYTCAFSVVAIEAGATCVVNVDMSKGALSEGRTNHQINGLDKHKSVFLPEQIFKSWSRIRKKGPFDVIIFDPPSFQKGSFVAEKDYRRLIDRIPTLMKDSGDILACLNAPELDVEFLKKEFNAHCPQASFVARIPASTDFPDINPERELKLLHYRFDKAVE